MQCRSSSCFLAYWTGVCGVFGCLELWASDRVREEFSAGEQNTTQIKPGSYYIIEMHTLSR